MSNRQCAPATTFVNRHLWPLLIAFKTIFFKVFTQKAIANFIIAYVLCWYRNPSESLSRHTYRIGFLQFEEFLYTKDNSNIYPYFHSNKNLKSILSSDDDDELENENDKNKRIETLDEKKLEILIKQIITNNIELDLNKNDSEKDLIGFISNSLELTANKIIKQDEDNNVDPIESGRQIYEFPHKINHMKKLSFNPKFTDGFTDADPNKCYILSFSGGGAKGAFSGGLAHGLALLYKYHGIKLRWDVLSGVSIGSLNSIWGQFYSSGQDTLQSSEIAVVWEHLSNKNVHNCRKTLSDNYFKWILRLINKRTKIPPYLCSTYPMLLFMRHLLQNRIKYKNRFWSATTYNFNTTLPFYFNEKTPISLLPSVIRSSSSFIGIFPPSDLPGLGFFGDGGIIKVLDIQNAIHRCFQSGKAKKEEDIVIDIVTTSDIPSNFLATVENPTTLSLYKGIGWYFGNYIFTKSNQFYELLKAIKRYPNVKYRHFLSRNDYPNSKIQNLGIFDFDIKKMKQTLYDGISSGFNNATLLKDMWSNFECNINADRSWSVLGKTDILSSGINDSFDVNSDSFTEYPDLKQEPLNNFEINKFIDFYHMSKINENNIRKLNNPIQKLPNYKEFLKTIINLFEVIFSIRFHEYFNEFLREREEILNREHYISNHTKHDIKYSIINNIPFFKASRVHLEISFGVVNYSQIVHNQIYSRFKAKKYWRIKKLINNTKRVSLNIAKIYAKEFTLKIINSYKEYDMIMEPLNELYKVFTEFISQCNKNPHNHININPLLFLFDEGPSSIPSFRIKNFIDVKQQEYLIKFLKTRFPDIDWDKKPNTINKKQSTELWDRFKISIYNYLLTDFVHDCLYQNDYIDRYNKLFTFIKNNMGAYNKISSVHYHIINKVSIYQLILPKIGLSGRFFTAKVESALRKHKFKESIELIESIFLKTSSTDFNLLLNSTDITGYSKDKQLKAIYDAANYNNDTNSFIATMQLENILPAAA